MATGPGQNTNRYLQAYLSVVRAWRALLAPCLFPSSAILEIQIFDTVPCWAPESATRDDTRDAIRLCDTGNEMRCQKIRCQDTMIR